MFSLKLTDIFAGAVSADKRSLECILNSNEKGNALILFVGGVAEVLKAIPGTYQLILKKRKGFVKIALTTG